MKSLSRGIRGRRDRPGSFLSLLDATLAFLVRPAFLFGFSLQLEDSASIS